jgi:hypothetical protein
VGKVVGSNTQNISEQIYKQKETCRINLSLQTTREWKIMECGCAVDPVSLKTKINALLFFIRTSSESHYGICVRATSSLFILYNLQNH